jgi:hypothetical protein
VLNEPRSLCRGLVVSERGLLEVVCGVGGGVLLLGVGGSVAVGGLVLLGGLAGGIGGTVGALVLLRLQLFDLLLGLGNVLQAC